MTVQDIKTVAATAVPVPVPVLPDTAPFSPDQRAWLNGFFAGMLSVDAAGASAVAGVPGPAQSALAAPPIEDDAPWHDPAMPIDERLALADGRPVRRKLFAAMAQQNCGQCGYLCETYADALATGAEAKQNLCVPGGKDTTRALKKLMEEAATVTPASAGATVIVAETPAGNVAPAAKPAITPGYHRDAPVEVGFVSSMKLNGPGSEKDTRHVVFDLSASGLEYAPGDSFGLIPRNDPALVDAVLAAMQAPSDFPIHTGIGDRVKSLRDTLIEDYALGPVAPDALFELAGYLVGGDRRRKARALAKGADPDGDASSYDVLSVLERLGPMHPDPEAFLECLEPLQPRLYSISSSPLATPGELHLTVDCVRYQLTGRDRLGVASTFLADRVSGGAAVKAYVQKAHGFGLPSDHKTPVIMVGPGTGIAPFRAFMWHREALRRAGTSVGQAWLFFGHQREASDFYYRDEFEGLLASGALTYLSTAWSRDGANKVYVQDRMREAGPALWNWLEQGAHFYVCGDAKRMAKDVETALADIAITHGGKTSEAAKAFVADLKSAGRYQADVY